MRGGRKGHLGRGGKSPREAERKELSRDNDVASGGGGGGGGARKAKQIMTLTEL